MKSNYFTRIAQKATVNDFKKEAKRVGYKIEGVANDFFDIKDGEATVMKGLHKGGGVWVMLFSKDYWQEPALSQ